MPFIEYKEKNFSNLSLTIIDSANSIIAEYQEQGFDLTLRQLYYQFVSRNLVDNKQSEYKRLGGIVNDARLAGLIDWNCIVDRTRSLKNTAGGWYSPKQIIESCADSYYIDKWQNQKHRLEVWIEKDALTGVISGVCEEFDIPYFSCRGYTSQSEMWSASQRFEDYIKYPCQSVIIIHLGDHDPSGIDMTRDIQERLETFLFLDEKFPVVRIALNINQVTNQNLPPNPAKLSDSRAQKYIKKYGAESWELDALEPSYITQIIEEEILSWREEDKWEEMVEKEATERNIIREIVSNL